MATSTTVKMDYGVMQSAIDVFKTVSDMLKTVIKVLTTLIGILRASAFFSAGTSLALANYLENIKNAIEKLVKIVDEFATDLSRAIDDHKKGDVVGKSYFGEGVR